MQGDETYLGHLITRKQGSYNLKKLITVLNVRLGLDDLENNDMSVGLIRYKSFPFTWILPFLIIFMKICFKIQDWLKIFHHLKDSSVSLNGNVKEYDL